MKVKNQSKRITFSEIKFSHHFMERLGERFNYRMEQILDQAAYFKIGTPDSRYPSLRSKVGKNPGYKFFFNERLNLIISVDECLKVATTAMFLHDPHWAEGFRY